MANSNRPTVKPAAKQSAGGVMDVARPGAGGISASSTSRPVIIKHPHLPDPMVNDTPRDDLPVPAEPPRLPAKKVIITPIHADVSNPAEPAEAVKPMAAPTKPALIVTSAPIAKPLPAAPVTTPLTTIADVADEPDTNGIPADSQQREADSAVARQRAAKLQKLIDEEEYFLPIETLEERRSRRIAIVGLLLIVILAVAWYDVALDANLLANSYNLPHSHIFSIR